MSFRRNRTLGSFVVFSNDAALVRRPLQFLALCRNLCSDNGKPGFDCSRVVCCKSDLVADFWVRSLGMACVRKSASGPRGFVRHFFFVGAALIDTQSNGRENPAGIDRKRLAILLYMMSRCLADFFGLVFWDRKGTIAVSVVTVPTLTGEDLDHWSRMIGWVRADGRSGDKYEPTKPFFDRRRGGKRSAGKKAGRSKTPRPLFTGSLMPRGVACMVCVWPRGLRH